MHLVLQITTKWRFPKTGSSFFHPFVDDYRRDFPCKKPSSYWDTWHPTAMKTVQMAAGFAEFPNPPLPSRLTIWCLTPADVDWVWASTLDGLVLNMNANVPTPAPASNMSVNMDLMIRNPFWFLIFRAFTCSGSMDVHQDLGTGPKDCMSCPAPCKTRPGQMTWAFLPLLQNGCYILTYAIVNNLCNYDPVL